MGHSPADSSSSTTPFLARPDIYDEVELNGSPGMHSRNGSSSDISDNDSVDDVDLETLVATSPHSPPPPYLEKSARWARNKPSGIRRALRNPRNLVAAAILLVLLVVGVFTSYHVSNSNTSSGLVAESQDTLAEPAMKTAASNYVLGPPTDSFWVNIRNDTQYITAWTTAGWTNDFMTYVNLLYLAKLTDRVAIVPPWQPSHLPNEAGYPPFSDVFDLPRLSRAMATPIIEWQDIKNVNSTHEDQLGCWSIWATVAQNENDKTPRGNKLEGKLNLDVAYTHIPKSAVMLPEYPNDPHTRFADIAALTFPDGRRDAHLPDSAPFPSPHSGATMLPDEHVACFDFPYYLGAWRNFEYAYDFSPAWRFVGTHARWTPRLEELTYSLVRETLNVPADAPTPPFISMHVRHGDFKVYCGDHSSKEGGCFASLDAYRAAVDEVKAELRERKGVEVEHVLVTSDEQDPEWWAEVRSLGWSWVDHEELGTAERYGLWYPVFVDAAVQSLGTGFVGTDKSTMSLIASRRVRDWQDGATRDVTWGEWRKKAKRGMELERDWIMI